MDIYPRGSVEEVEHRPLTEFFLVSGYVRVLVFMLCTCACVHVAYVRLCSCCARVLVFMLMCILKSPNEAEI